MKKLASMFCIAACGIILTACGGKERKATNLDDCPVVAHQNNQGVTVCNFSLVNKDTLDMPVSSLLSQIEIIRLDSSDEALVGNDCRIFASEFYVGIYSSAVGAYKLYNKKGEYLRTIATRGQGPDEFAISIYDSYIDEDEGKIYLLQMAANKLLVFDLQGKALSPIPLAYTVHKGRFKINADRTLVMTVLPFRDTPAVVWKQDFEGNVIQEIASSHFVIDPGDYSNEVNTSMNVPSVIDFSLFQWMSNADSLYHYEEATNALIPVFTTRFEEGIDHGYTELPEHYMVQLFQPATPTYAPSIPTILIDKESLKGSYVRLYLDALGDIECPVWIEFNRGYFAISMHPTELKEKIERRLQQAEPLDPEVKQRMIELNDSMTDDDNTIVIVGELKTKQQEGAPKNKQVSISGTKTQVDTLADKSTQNKIATNTKVENSSAPSAAIANEDTGVPHTTAALINPQEYFRANNKYKNWDPKNPQKVVIRATIEKDGTITNVSILKKCDEDLLNEEAVRLIRDVKINGGQIESAKDKNGNPVESKWTISVVLPPR